MQNIFQTIALATPMYVCLFWTFAFLLQSRKGHNSIRIMFGFMLTASLLYFGHFCVFNDLYGLIPITDTIYTFSTLSVYPIFYVYLVALTGKLNWKHWSCLLPGVLIGGIIGICYFSMSKTETFQFIEACIYKKAALPASASAELSYVAHELMKYTILLEILFVLPLGFRRLSRFKEKVNGYFSNTEHKDLREIRLLLTFFVITSVFSMCADLIGRSFFVDSFVLTAIPLLAFSSMLFIIGYVCNRQKFTIDDLAKESNSTTALEYDLPIEDSTEEETLVQKIDRKMKEEQLFLQPDLKLSDLAEGLNTNRTYIYEAIKAIDQKNPVSFSDYVNRYRIEYSMMRLKDNPDESIEDIMLQSGFISKSTYYNNFKKFTGMTPREYINNMKRG